MNYTCITGVDGVGKSTFVRHAEGDWLKVFVPQYHLSEALSSPCSPRLQELAEVSAAIEAWSQRCDRESLVHEKPFALFAGILLAGPVLKELHKLYPDRALLLDRDPLLDPLIYLSAYRDILSGSIHEEGSPFTLTHVQSSLIGQEMSTIARRTGQPVFDDASMQLRVLLMASLRENSSEKILLQLRTLLDLPWPKRTQILTLDATNLNERLKSKHREQAAEFHETPQWIWRAQEGYRAMVGKMPWPVSEWVLKNGDINRSPSR